MFSVVIPVFNKRSSIVRAVDSVLAQCFSNFELIIVDDGSTDEGIDLISSYKDSRIVFCSQENKGVSAARNCGVQLARYQYVCFLDADDSWQPQHLSIMAKLIKDYPGCALYATAHRVFENGHFKIIKSPFREQFRGVLDDFFKDSLDYSVANSSKVVVPLEIFKKVGGFPNGVKVGEDLYLWSRLALLGHVAYDSCQTVTIFREFDPVRRTRATSVPYLLTYFHDKKETLKRHPSLKKYIKRVGLKHVVSAAINGDKKSYFIRVFWLSKFDMFLSLLLIPLVAVPRGVVSFLIRFR